MASSITVYCFAYNAAVFLPKMLQSLADQTRLPDEVVLVDDGSDTDPSPVIAPFRDRLKIRLIRHDRNRGMLHARQTAIDHASSDFVTQLDADDTLASNALQDFTAALADTAADIAFCQLQRSDEPPVPTGALRTYKSNDLLRRVLTKETIGDATMPLAGGGKVIRTQIARDVVESIRSDEHMNFGEDVLFLIGTYLRADSIVALPQAHYHYTQHDLSAMAQRLQQQKPSFLRSQKHFVDLMDRLTANLDKNSFDILPLLDDWTAQRLTSRMRLYFKPKKCFGPDFGECLASLDPDMRPVFRKAASYARQRRRAQNA